VTHPFWNFETLGIVLALFCGLLIFAFCFGLVIAIAKKLLSQTLGFLSRFMPLSWRVAVVRWIPWLWDAGWRESYLKTHSEQ
jgi:flagellar biosynthesis protein FliQ